MLEALLRIDVILKTTLMEETKRIINTCPCGKHRVKGTSPHLSQEWALRLPESIRISDVKGVRWP